MKTLFDTSVLVAAILSGHSRHSVCLPLLQQAQLKQTQGLISTHTLAEMYSTLTRIPKTNITPTLARDLICDNLQNFERVLLTAEDYDTAIDLMVQHQLPGGGIFDALIAQAALKAQADVLLTLNPKHFIRLGTAIASKVETPN
jgi:predicted nucleic acid-binding protein